MLTEIQGLYLLFSSHLIFFFFFTCIKSNGYIRLPPTSYSPSQVQIVETAMTSDPALKKNMVYFLLFFPVPLFTLLFNSHTHELIIRSCCTG